MARIDMTPPSPDALCKLAQPLAVSSANCQAMLGMSWDWTYAFARKHGVPIWHLSRKPMIPARELLTALKSAAEASAPALTFEQELAQMEADFAQKRALSDPPPKSGTM